MAKICIPAKNYFIPLFVLAVLLTSSVLTAGCIQPSASLIENESEPIDPLLANFSSDDLIYINNITTVMDYVVIQGKRLGVNLTEEEMTVRAVKVAAKYADTPNPSERSIPPGYYALNWGEFHLSIGRAYNLTDEEILRYVPLTFTSRIYGHHKQPIPESYYDSVLDPEHKAVAEHPSDFIT